MKIQQIVAFQGLGPRNWPILYQIPAIQEAIHWGQKILSSNNIQIEERQLDIIKACKENGLVLEEHSQTCWQQPAIFLASMAYWKMWLERNPNINPLLLGFSFGEWTAATAAGCMDEETGLLVATMRGFFTSRAGGSSLLINAGENAIPIKRIRIRCKRVGGIWLANINSSSQGLISGHSSQLDEMEKSLKEHYPRLRLRPLSVGGAFHTPMMRKARDQFEKWLEQVEFQKPEFPMLLNATRETTRDPEKIKNMLVRQLSARLNFKKLAEELPEGVQVHELCLESQVIGPLIRQTHQAKHGAEAPKLATLPFPA